MKIGILTFHEADNCGAVLQAYALTEAIKSNNHNSEVEIINYHMPNITNQYKYLSLDKNSITSLSKSFLSSLFHIKRKITSRPKYIDFRRNHMNISEVVFLKSSEIKNYDAYIVGSDQVWNDEVTGNDSAFYLDFVDKNHRKISYAASIAKDDLNHAQLQEIAEKIRSFDAISIRETSAVNNLQPYTTKKIHQVLDPTLIVDKSIWEKLIKSDKLHQLYILVYMVGYNSEVLEFANKMSKELNLPVWCITTATRTRGYDFKFIKDVGPLEFLDLFSNAEFIISGSFHGTVFSIIFNKNFVTIPHKETSSRMIDLLYLLGLEERIIHDDTVLDKSWNLEMNYKTVNRRLEELKESSLSFIKKSLDFDNMSK